MVLGKVGDFKGSTPCGGFDSEDASEMIFFSRSRPPSGPNPRCAKSREPHLWTFSIIGRPERGTGNENRNCRDQNYGGTNAHNGDRPQRGTANVRLGSSSLNPRSTSTKG